MPALLQAPRLTHREMGRLVPAAGSPVSSRQGSSPKLTEDNGMKGTGLRCGTAGALVLQRYL